MKAIFLILLFLLTACASSARVTTEAERSLALTTLTTAETGILVAVAKGKVSAEEAALAQQQLAELRALVEGSATVPISWQDVFHRITNFGLQWVIVKETDA
jgi:hypothetical protein